ncbi:MAG TPA: antibiotic biosynthesis monooxygenase [Candidatus Cybelea sp.]|jgi:heme-degrading monooxygenase HmoA
MLIRLKASAGTSVIATWTFEVNPADFDALATHARLAIDQLPPLSGWLGSEVLGSEDRTRILVLSEWESRDAWARGQWDVSIGKVLEAFTRRGRSQEFRLYFPVLP